MTAYLDSQWQLSTSGITSADVRRMFKDHFTACGRAITGGVPCSSLATKQTYNSENIGAVALQDAKSSGRPVSDYWTRQTYNAPLTILTNANAAIRRQLANTYRFQTDTIQSLRDAINILDDAWSAVYDSQAVSNG